MPGFVIHLAAANVHLCTYADVRDREAFLHGVIDPDLRHPKRRSHYGEDTAHPGLALYASAHTLRDDYQRGYFFHLLTDHLFYNEFFRGLVWSPAVYDDYDRMNRKLIEAYGVVVPKEVRGYVGFRDDDLQVLDYARICDFIEYAGAIDLDQWTSDSF